MGLIEMLMRRKIKKMVSGEVRCNCGEIAIPIPGEKTEIFLCQKCNKLIYYSIPSSIFKIKPFSLSWLRRKRRN